MSKDLFAFLDNPPLGPAALPEASNPTHDEFDAKLKSASGWPDGYPNSKKTGPMRTRFHYRQTNTQQAENEFRSILLMYRAHVLKEHSSASDKYPYLEEYLAKDPLGHFVYPDNDARIYQNAPKLVQAQWKASTSQTSKVTDLTADTEAAPATAATEPGTASPVPPKTKKKATKSAVSPGPKSKKKRGKKKKTQAKATAEAASSVVPSDSTTPEPTTKVRTAFAGVLAKVQLRLYFCLRANIKRFMDKTCNGILESRIALFEQTHQLKNRARFEVQTRYTWDKLKDDTFVLCCQMATPGFYFLPLYTTPRMTGQIVSQWCLVIRKIHTKLVAFDADWGSLSERDAMKRLHSFLSKKEVGVIEDELKSNHAELWEANHKSIREFFSRNTLATAITLINQIDTSKFPLDFDPLKHTPAALKQTLYSRAELDKHKAECDAEMKTLRDKLARAQETIAKLQRKPKPSKPTKRPRENSARKDRKERNDSLVRSLKGESAKVRKLMRPGRSGDRPCINCARSGLRLFHTEEECNPAQRERNAKRKKERKEADPEDFPPKDADRKHPRSSYKKGACPHCIREDVPPEYANHHPGTCYRRPGGECDKAEAFTRNERARLIRKLLSEKKAAAKKDKGGGKEKANRGKTPKKVRFSHMSVKPPPHKPGSPGGAITSESKRSQGEAKVSETNSTRSKKNEVESLLSEPGTKIRTRKYKLSEYAKAHPLTSEELKFAKSLCPSWVNLGHCRYEMESVGHEKNLKDLRRRLKAKKASKAPLLGGPPPDYTPSVPTFEPASSYSQSYSRSRSRTRSETESSESYSDSVSSSRSRSPSRGRGSRHGRRRHRRRRTGRRHRRKGRGRRRTRGKRRDRRTRRARSTRRRGHTTTLSRRELEEAVEASRPPSPPYSPPQEIETPPPSPPPTPPPTPPSSPVDAGEGVNPPTTTSVMRFEDFTHDPSEVCYDSDSIDPLDKYPMDDSDEPGLYIPSGVIVSKPNSCSERLPNVWCETHTPLHSGLLSSSHKETKRQEEKEEKEEEAIIYDETSLRDLPYGNWLPACSSTSPKISMPNNKHSPFDSSNAKRLPSETMGTRLLQVFMKYRDAKGVTRVGRVKLDTQSNGCYSKPGVSLPRPWRPWEPRVVQGIGADLLPLGDPYYFTVIKNGVPIKIDSNAPTPGVLNDGCIALLGLDVIYNLGIDVAHAIKHSEHLPVKYLSDQEELIDNRKLEAYAEYGKRGYTPAIAYKTCNLSERVVKQYLDTHPDDYVKKPIDIESVDISPELPREIRELILLLCKRYEDVFASHTNTLPPALRGVQPHMFKMKEGYVHRMAPRPTFSPARARAINDWLDWALEVGLVEEATNTSYASRLILAAKRKGSTPKSAPPDGIRVAWAGVDINEGITKTVPTYTDAWQQLYKVANLKYKFSADGLKQYWSIPLCQEAREITAFWTPRGLFQFTRMVMGTKNAATVAQNAYTKAMHTMLPKRSFPNLANFADDFLGGANTGESLAQVFEDFLSMCRQAKITLNPAKVRIGYEKEQFFGLTVDKGKIEPAMRNIDPVVNMDYPTNRSELRSVMGIFNQFSSFIKDYGKDNSPAAILNALVSPKAEWCFTDRHRKALDQLKRQVQQGIHLYAPDNSYPLILETDGSDDGWGAVLYQLIDGEKRIIKMWSKQWKTEAWHKKPPYHREAKAWMNGMTLALPYAMCNPFPLQCWTDHSPLTWVKHTSGKGPVSQFIIDTLSLVDYEMNYLKGEDNVIADGLSRFPMLGPQKLRRTGLSNALDVLLATLLTTKVDTSKIWFDARRDTKFLLPNIFDWCEARTKLGHGPKRPSSTCYQDALSVSKVTKLKYTFGIWAPPADKICRQVSAALKRNVPFACLVPSDLVDRICVNAAGQVSPAIQTAVTEARKISFLASGLTWIIHGITIEEPFKQVYVNNRVTPEIELDVLMKHLSNSDRTPPLPACRTRAEWVREQRRHRCADLWRHEPRVFEVQDGLLVMEPKEGDPYLTIVPKALQKPLIKWTHYRMCHMSAGKVFNVLKKRFHFKHMFKLCHEVVAECALCNLLKARMKHAHKHFRAKLAVEPRTSYGADYYSVKKNKLGYNNVLGIIDLATGNLVLRAVKGRNAHNTAHTLFYDVVVHKGVPLRFHSDAAKEFLSTAMSTLQTLLGISKSDTLAHNPKSNAKIERVWQFVGRALRSMTAEEYAQFHLYMPIIAHVWNCTPDADTNITPFEAEHGMPCRSVAESVTQNPPPEGLPACASDLKTVAVSAAAYNEIITNVKAVERANAANKLNAYGEAIKEYRVGDKVAFYLPPNDAEAKRMGKNPKHMLQYQGPGEIVEALSDNNTAFKIRCGSRTYKRNIMHISPYTSSQPVPAEVQLRVDNTVNANTFVAVLDATNDKKYHIAKVLEVGEQSTTLHYYATKSRRLRDAIWRPLYAHPRSNVILMEQPDTIIRNHLRYTGTIDTRPIDDSLILLPNIGMTDRLRVNSRTRTILSRKAGYTHHRLERTWDPAT